MLPITSDFRVEPADYTVDFKDLRSIREPVFVQEQQVPLELEWDKLDPQCHHVIARDSEHRPIGTGRLTPQHKIGRMAVLREWRGQGVGEAMLVALIDKARELGLRKVSLNSQASAIGFYEKFGFQPVGERFEEAGIEHQAMSLELEPKLPATRLGAAPRGPSQAMADLDGLDPIIEAVHLLLHQGRRDLRIYTRDLEPALFAHPLIVQAFKDFATAGGGAVARFVVQDPAQARRQPHPLLSLAQRLPSGFDFRTPQDPEDMQYPSVYVVNDRDGYLFRLLGSRFEADWSPALPARNRQLREHFERVWERARPATELRSLAL